MKCLPKWHKNTRVHLLCLLYLIYSSYRIYISFKAESEKYQTRWNIFIASVHLHPKCPALVGFYRRFTHWALEVLIRWWCHYRWHQACVTWGLAGPSPARLVTGLRWILSLIWEQTERGWQSSYARCETVSVTAQQCCSWATGSI